jgi:hypothetical protein
MSTLSKIGMVGFVERVQIAFISGNRGRVYHLCDIAREIKNGLVEADRKQYDHYEILYWQFREEVDAQLDHNGDTVENFLGITEPYLRGHPTYALLSSVNNHWQISSTAYLFRLDILNKILEKWRATS